MIFICRTQKKQENMNYKEYSKLLAELRGLSHSEISEYLKRKNALCESSPNDDGIIHLPKGMTVEEYAKNNHFVAWEDCLAKWGIKKIEYNK